MKRHVARSPPFCSLPLTTLAEFCLMNQNIKWRLWLVNISWQLWPICSIQALLIGLGSSQHTSAILDYAHDLLSVVNGWIITLSTPQKSNSVTRPLDYSDIKLRDSMILSKIFDKFVKLGLLGKLWPSGHRPGITVLTVRTRPLDSQPVPSRLSGIPVGDVFLVHEKDSSFHCSLL